MLLRETGKCMKHNMITTGTFLTTIGKAELIETRSIFQKCIELIKDMIILFSVQKKSNKQLVSNLALSILYFKNFQQKLMNIQN